MIEDSIYSKCIFQAKDIVNRRKLALNFPLLNSIDKSQNEILNEALNFLEIEVINSWDPKEYQQLRKYSNYCTDCFNILQVLSIPENESEKIHHILKLICYGYLGERWESARRFIINHEKEVSVDINSEVWNDRLFKKIYYAIIYLVRKSSWDDLNKAVDIINELRQEQVAFEEIYFDKVEFTVKKSAAFELAALYYLARSVEIVGQFQINGQPDDASSQITLNFEKSKKYSDYCGNIEMNLLIQVLEPAFQKMIINSIWSIDKKFNFKESDKRAQNFIELITKSNRPIVELLYPQRNAIIDKDLLNPRNKAVVVNLPTSSGKTIIAEFRILQAINQFSDRNGWVAYVAPTRALVNQIAIRLKEDLGSNQLNLIIEKMSGALEIDSFEKNILEKQNNFNILVTTPEKLYLLIRQGIEETLGRPLCLVVIDEAHNIGNKSRGINLELLLSTIKTDCNDANFLLLTPFIPNSEEIAKWLDPINSKSISIELNWQPNDKVIGMLYVKGRARKIKSYYKPLMTYNNQTIAVDDEIIIEDNYFEDIIFSDVNNKKYLLTALIGLQLPSENGTLIMAHQKMDTFKIADFLYNHLADSSSDQNSEIELVQKFVAAEMGDNFPLVKYLSKGIGVHHAGLPDEIKYLIEYLMEKGLIKYLIATTTIAQGINFPISNILMAAYSYPWTSEMPLMDFWNLVGRSGRIYQENLGLIGISVAKGNSSADALKVSRFVQKSTEDLISTLVEMVDDILTKKHEIKLEDLWFIPEWSVFLQYISHMYNQSQNLSVFICGIEQTMERTYGYHQLSDINKEILKNSVIEYAEKLDKNKAVSTLSDKTGISPEAVKQGMDDVRNSGVTSEDWSNDKLFFNDSVVLQKLVGIMLNIPEIRKQLKEIKINGTVITQSKLSNLIADWVNGKEFSQITNDFYGSDSIESMTSCVAAISSNLVNPTTWGLAAIQQMPGNGLDLDDLSEIEIKKLMNLPAMVYYGVNSDEAVLLRKNNVPRSIAIELGKLLHEEFYDDIYSISTSQIFKWLNNIEDQTWENVVSPSKNISGIQYKEIWRILNGFH